MPDIKDQSANDVGILINSQADPLLTVVMPVFNAEKYLREAIDSVLNQTYKNFELIIINDGSTDRSVDVIRSYTDERIRFIDNVVNKGVAYSRNLGLKEAKGEFLTWTDSDDINLPDRFELQIQFMISNKEFGACGTWLSRFDEKKVHYIQKTYSDPSYIKAALVFRPHVPNATVMLRMAKIREYDVWYNNELPIAEDYDFILRCSQHFPITNLPKVLYKYRILETSIFGQFEAKEDESFAIHKIVYAEALKQFNIKPDEEELMRHRMLSSRKLFAGFLEYKECFNWLLYIKNRNKELKVFEPEMFRKILAERFLFISKKASKLGLTVFFFYIWKANRQFKLSDPGNLIKLFLRCLIKYNKF